MVLESGPGACLIPAHIWTPWFSLLGSKSGFDSVEECFSDLSDHIFALETGLSSDPQMNWRLSRLDRFTLISNSDAHSVAKIGREANLFGTTLGYPGIIDALKSGDTSVFKGTIEFFPEEGKYHLDGHRQCNQWFNPNQTRANKGICPLCQKQLTLGVLYRVEQLADRPEGYHPPNPRPFYRLVPLDEILAEILQVGTGAKAVAARMRTCLEVLGSETEILLTLSPEAIASAGIPLLDQAINRMRQGRLTIQPGYDGQYGKVSLFGDEERSRLAGQKTLFAFNPCTVKQKPPKTAPPLAPVAEPLPQQRPGLQPIEPDLNPQQAAALSRDPSPLIVVAGPGTGKTHTLTLKIADLLCCHHLSSAAILALTFTQKASREMRQRLEGRLPPGTGLPLVTTFHGFCLVFLRHVLPASPPVVVGEEDRLAMIRDAIPLAQRATPRLSAAIASRFIEVAKQQLKGPADDLHGIGTPDERLAALTSVYAAYQEILGLQGLMDYEDLIFKTVKTLETDPRLANQWQDRFTHVFVDEYQDINHGQQRLIQCLSPQGKNLFVIGDPDQSIYGFRGSQPEFFLRFTECYPEARVISLTRNYRSADTIVKASVQMMANHRHDGQPSGLYSPIKGLAVIGVREALSERAEAVMIGKIIEKMIGGTGFLAIDAGKVDSRADAKKGFGDFAVIARTHDQLRVFADVFTKAGIPFETANRGRLLSDPLVAMLIAWLRVIAGQAAFLDLQRAATGIVPASVFSVLKAWSLQNHWDAATAMTQVRRFPLPGLTLSQQKRLCVFLDELDTVKKTLAGRSVVEQVDVVQPLVAARLKAAETAFLETVKEQARHYPDSLDDFLSSLALLSDADLCRLRGERVSLLTMHAAKGMEFDVVFIAGAEDGLIPLAHSTDLDEERRLFYVAMTRARENLFVCYCRRRRIFGQDHLRRLSPFMADIRPELVDRRQAEMKPKKPKGPEQLGLF